MPSLWRREIRCPYKGQNGGFIALGETFAIPAMAQPYKAGRLRVHSRPDIGLLKIMVARHRDRSDPMPLSKADQVCNFFQVFSGVAILKSTCTSKYPWNWK